MTRTWKRGRRSMTEVAIEAVVSEEVAWLDCRRRGWTIKFGE
jgi:hypothetical protein